jgi:plastocyanin
MRSLVLPLALVLAAPAAAQPDWRGAPEYDVRLSAYDIEPGELRLKAGEPVRLRFVNGSNQQLTFSAEGFFRSGQLRRRDADMVKGGSVQVPPLSTRTVVIVPKAGRYAMRGANLLHRLLGMSGKIVVE